MYVYILNLLKFPNVSSHILQEAPSLTDVAELVDKLQLGFGEDDSGRLWILVLLMMMPTLAQNHVLGMEAKVQVRAMLLGPVLFVQQAVVAQKVCRFPKPRLNIVKEQKNTGPTWDKRWATHADRWLSPITLNVNHVYSKNPYG